MQLLFNDIYIIQQLLVKFKKFIKNILIFSVSIMILNINGVFVVNSTNIYKNLTSMKHFYEKIN